MRWETLDEVKGRMRRVADKYANYDKVIFVGHGMAIRALTYIGKMKLAEIVECVIGEDKRIVCIHLVRLQVTHLHKL